MVAVIPLPSILAKLNARKNRLLLVLQACISQPHQYDAVRKILLDELGRDGFEKELEEALQQTDRVGTGRNIHAGKEVPK
ncbi:MAG: hypothetical protein ACYCY8_08545 [Burkholderiales bacterium]